MAFGNNAIGFLPSYRPSSLGVLFEQFLNTGIEEVAFYGGSPTNRFGVHGDTLIKAWKLWQQFLGLGALYSGINRECEYSTEGDLKFRRQKNTFTLTNGNQHIIHLHEYHTNDFTPGQWNPEKISKTLIWIPGCESTQLDEQLRDNGKMAELQRFWQLGGNCVLVCGAAYAFSHERHYRFKPDSDETTVKECRTPLYPGTCKGPAFHLYTPSDPEAEGLGTKKLLSSYMHAAPEISWKLAEEEEEHKLQALVGGGGYFEPPEKPVANCAINVVAYYQEGKAAGKIASLISSYINAETRAITGSAFFTHIHAAYDDGDIDVPEMKRLFPDNPTNWAEIKKRLKDNLDERLTYTFSAILKMYQLHGTVTVPSIKQ